MPSFIRLNNSGMLPVWSGPYLPHNFCVLQIIYFITIDNIFYNYLDVSEYFLSVFFYAVPIPRTKTGLSVCPKEINVCANLGYKSGIFSYIEVIKNFWHQLTVFSETNIHRNLLTKPLIPKQVVVFLVFNLVDFS